MFELPFFKNFIEFLFINLIVSTLVLGLLVNLIEPYLPVFITQTYRYGKHSHKGEKDKTVSKCEIPKSWFKHFYVFAAFWSVGSFWLAVNTFVLGKSVPGFVIKFLDLTGGSSRRETIDGLSTLIALALITLQCLRRFYETHFIQVFSKTSKINISHYIIGYVHYFGTVLAILYQSQGFISGSIPEIISIKQLSFYQLPFIALFMFAWTHQFKSNLILANLRKNKTGKTVTEKHFLPTGGFFQHVSSPHMFFEVLMYVALYGIVFQNTSFVYVFIWVLVNQVENSWLTHKWYKENYKNYPKERKAIFPKIF